ncbi:fibronectin type III domain-containing protein [Dyadobacter frigoris]|uniref:Fibronectin type III domain-containing protein n=1 Tax=Dyadobacter frigoris TaxID=2576211 RepID=A0A4U6D767_9BACT|nr:fibronectin type III domain-containing protein [Dyadobacter frigoris]TKT92596.1 fibronectin type III domain-containing protein [Dyadobacter frigoris]GLU51482.1 hypothetical protein Dfri01_09430 [Dyadobacter frigoris]
MKASFYIIVICSFSLTSRGLAQQAQVTAGPYGVFIQFEKLLHGPQYVVERLLIGANNTTKPDWKPVCTTDKPPQSAQDLTARLAILTRKNPLYELPNDSLTQLLYGRYHSISSVDSLGTYAYNPQYLEALGLGFLDTEVMQGRRYDYRISPLRTSAGAVYHNPPTVSVPGSGLTTTIKSVSYSTNGNEVKIKYHIKKARPDIAGARILRASYAQTGFSECPAEWRFRKGDKDSLFLEITDHNARRKMLYSYIVFLKDFLGNESNASDTITITNLRPQEALPTIYSIKTSSEEVSSAIRVAWKLSSTRDLQGIEIWRSEQFDSEYKSIGTASATDTVFYDNVVEPVRGYYYQIRLNGTYDRSSQSVRVSGMLKANRPALLSPAHFTLTESNDTLYFRWQSADFDTRGYYLYFSNSQSDSLKLYSDIILASGLTMNYQVPIKRLAIGVGYRWAVAAINTSYNVGPMSEPVYSQPRYPDRLAAPLNPEMLYQEGRALLVWENMRTIDPYILGYIVERKADDEKVFKEIYRQTIDDKSRNNYEDLTVKPGQQYNYRIRAYGMNKKLSAFSTEITYFKSLPPVLSVRGLNVMATNKGVRVAWDTPFDVPDKIVVYRYTEKTIAPKVIGSVAGQQAEFIDKYATPGIAYHYSIVVVGTDKRESAPTDLVGVQWR